jgi:uncharacterized protein YceK
MIFRKGGDRNDQMRKIALFMLLTALLSGCASYVDNYNHSIAKEKQEKRTTQSATKH